MSEEKVITLVKCAQAIYDVEKYRMPVVFAMNPDSLVPLLYDEPPFKMVDVKTIMGYPVVFSDRIPLGEVVGLAGELPKGGKSD